ncbi:hypothetical protein MMC12_004281 [Toensbergia leucococca]|nr:hypothetical protein [Toensbergia leucococca]
MGSVAKPHAPAVIPTSTVLPALCIIAVSLRFWSRRLQLARLMLDDWLVLIALIFTIGIAVALLIGVHLKAIGFPTPPTPTSPLTISAEAIEWAVQLMQVLQLGFVKLSFIFFFRRIFSVGKASRFNQFAMGMIVLIILWTMAFFFSILFACRGHLSAWWRDTHAQVTISCINVLVFEQGYPAADCIMDFMIIAMPIPMIWQLQMATSRKRTLTAIFFLGALAVIASIVRMIVYYQARAIAFHNGIDHDLLITQVLLWSLIESCLANIAACLPILCSLFRRPWFDALTLSARRILSLLSFSRNTDMDSNKTAHRSNSTTSHAQIIPNHSESTHVEIYAMHDGLKKPFEQTIVGPSEIAVNSSITQYYNIV